MENKQVQISKTLSYILRHGAVKENVPIRPDGFVCVDDLLKNRKFKNVSIDELVQIVETNNKQRFALRTLDDGRLYIRANQGHTLQLVDRVETKPITEEQNASQYPIVVHGTYAKNMDIIMEKGLSKMERNHVHFAQGLNALSGMRSDVEVLIYLDLVKALRAGLVFEESENGVILCAGDKNGYIKPEFFLKTVYRTKTN